MPHPNGNIILEVPTGCKHQRMQENNCEQQCGWRRSGIRTSLQHKFPANREFYREFPVFQAPRTDFVAKSRCTAATFHAIPYTN
jgi:hypothetical protein